MADNNFRGNPDATLSALNKLRQQNVLCDIILIVGSKKIPAHRIVLAASSEYFHKMFTSQLVEAHQKEISIHAVEELAMEALIDFFYTTQLSLNENNVEDLLSAATLLQLDDLRVACCKLLRRQLNPSNCLGIGDFAESYACKELEYTAHKYVCDAFQWVIEEEEFLLLPVTQLVKIISSDDLRVDTEELVYMAVMRWVKHDVLQRQKLLSQVLSHVRLPLLGLHFLLGTVSCESLIGRNVDCSRLVEQAKNRLLELQSGPGKDLEVLFIAGGGNQCSILEGFDVWPSQWRKMASILPYVGPRAAYLNGRVYLVGRLEDKGLAKAHSSMEIFDPERNRWSRGIAPSAWFGGLVALGGYLYSIGGSMSGFYGPCGPSKLVERYDPRRKKWINVAPMTIARTGHTVVTVGEFIYVLGGEIPESSVERYDPREDQWTLTARIDLSRCRLEAVALNGMIYITGRRASTRCTCNTERYNPTTNSWLYIKDPKGLFGKHSVHTSLLAINKQLYAITDISKTSNGGVIKNFSYVEVYDEKLDDWFKCGCMQFPFIDTLNRAIAVIPASKNYARSDFYPNVPLLKPRTLSGLFRKQKKPFLANFQKPWPCFQDKFEDCDPEGDEDSDIEYYKDNADTYANHNFIEDMDSSDDDEFFGDSGSDIYFFDSDLQDEEDIDEDDAW